MNQIITLVGLHSIFAGRVAKTYFFILLSAASLFLNSSAYGQGTWRWDQKVLVDNAVSSIDFATVKKSTIHDQVAMTPYKHMGSGDISTNRHVSEDTVYSIQCLLVGYKIESNDDDYHIVLMDPDTKETLVSEIPNPELDPAAQSQYVDKYIQARKSFANILNDNSLAPPTQTLNGDKTGSMFQIPVVVTGVGFWDLYGHLDKVSGLMVGHGTGSAVSGREIHPILAIEPVSKNGSGSIPSKPALKAQGGNPTPPAPDNNLNNTNTGENQMASSTQDVLFYMILAALLGMAGQLFRVVVGLKKLMSNTNVETTTSSVISANLQQILFSLLIGGIVGAVAGVLSAVVTKDFTHISQSSIFGLVAAGYAGTDFIEGFVLNR